MPAKNKIHCSFFIIRIVCRTVKTAYQLKSNEVTVASINHNLAYELVILLIFVNNENFVNIIMGKVSHAYKMQMQTLHAWVGIRSNLG